jgi:hypothetical protein
LLGKEKEWGIGGGKGEGEKENKIHFLFKSTFQLLN